MAEVGYIFPDDAAKQVVEVGKAIQATDNILLKFSEDTAKMIEMLTRQNISFEQLQKTEKQTTETTKQLDEMSKRLAASEKRLNDLMDERTKTILANQKAAQDLTNELKRELTVTNALEGSYEQLNAQLNQNIAAYKKMSAAERENVQVGGQLLKTIQAQDAELKKIDATMGRQQRNVGNYKSHWDGLGNSIQQIGREFPALAYGPKVFFSALSNNLPILAEQLKMAKDELKALNAQGIKGTPIWKQALKSILSWQTAILAGITILTLYGDELVDFIGKLFNSAKAFDSVKEANKQMGDAMSKAAENSSKEAASIDVLYAATQDINRSQKERNEAVDELQEKYPSYFGNLSNEAILAGNASEQYKSLKDAIFAKAKAQAFADKIAENEVKIFELQQKGGEKVGKTIGILQGLFGAGVGTSAGGFFGGNIVKEITGLEEVNEKLKESINISDLLYEENTKKEKIGRDKKKEAEEKLAKDLMLLIEKNIDEIDKKERELDEKREKRAADRLKIEAEFAFKIRQLSEENQNAELKKADKETESALKKIKEIRDKEDERNKWLWEKQKEDEENRKKSNQEIIKGAGDLGATLFDLKKAQLEREFEMAEGNAAKQAEINAKLAKNEKQKALFDIAINTASAIVKSLPNIALSAIVAAIGAIQAATVAAKTVPKFAAGTEFSPSEFIAGEAGREIVRLKSGEVILAENATHFKGNKFKGATVYTNRETEQIIKKSGENNNFVFDTKELQNGLKAVEKAINRKPVMITDNSGRVVGKETNNYREMYLNRLRNGR